jgi:hypothetical protein
VQKASQYHLHAEECRGLVAKATKPEHKAMLGQMAETWDDLAEQRERLIGRRERIAALEQKSERAGALS